ncbi:MAG: TMEM175 family protein [Ktedonobacterales bacterium]
MSDADEEMPTPLGSRRQHRQGWQIRTQRLEAFSDGVFAIAVTLLVLDLAVPAGPRGDLLGAFARQWPSYLAYVVSFATIGAVWLGHSQITEYLERADGTLVRLNLLLLLFVSLLPFPTRLIAQNIAAEDRERVAVTIYGITLLLTTGLLALLWWYALRAHLVRPDTDDKELRILTQRLTPGLAGYVLLLVLGLVMPVLAVIGYLLVALFILLPLRLPKRRTGAR